MTDERILSALLGVESSVNAARTLTETRVTAVRDSVRDNLARVKEETSVRLSSSETVVIHSATIVAHDANYHLLRAYFHASPSLVAIILAIYSFVKLVVEIVSTINSILVVITGETLAYWLDKIMPGFETAWNSLMNKISEFSSQLGWGADGIIHVINIAKTGALTVGAITGKDPAWIKSKFYERTLHTVQSFHDSFWQWQNHPGQMMEYLFSLDAENVRLPLAAFMSNLTSKLEGAADKVETVAQGLGDMTSEVLSLRNDMPAFIAKNIPHALWDAVGYADTMINDRLLPRLDDLRDRLDEVDKLLDKYKADTTALAKRIARPGDLLAEIASLPDYIRKDQEAKIDDVASRKYNEDANKYAVADAGIIAELERVSEAMKVPFPSPSFLMLEEIPRHEIAVPGAAGVETWFVGDF